MDDNKPHVDSAYPENFFPPQGIQVDHTLIYFELKAILDHPTLNASTSLMPMVYRSMLWELTLETGQSPNIDTPTFGTLVA